jgi:hypothetical protein
MPHQPSPPTINPHSGGDMFQTTTPEQDELERQEVERKNAELDAVMLGYWNCRCCREGNSFGSSTGLCRPCEQVVAKLQAERLGAEKVAGVSRAQLAAQYLASQT